MITIDLSCVRDICSMVTQLSPIFSLKEGDREDVTLNLFVRMIYPEYLTLIVAAFSWAANHNIQLNIAKLTRDPTNYYPDRINFFELIQYEYKYSFFRRWSSKGRFIEITPAAFDTDKGISIPPSIVDNIISIFRDNYNVEESIYKSLNYCLWEQIDNIQNHSGKKGTGYVVAQNYPINQEVRICVVDTGRGVFDSLTKTQESKYSQLTYKEAISKCIEERVTCGTGMGNGLYHSAQFISKNRGAFILYSGNYYVEVVDGTIQEAKRGSKWEGTIVFQKVKTNNPVNYNEVFNNCPLPTSVSDCDELIDGLWG